MIRVEPNSINAIPNEEHALNYSSNPPYFRITELGGEDEPLSELLSSAKTGDWILIKELWDTINKNGSYPQRVCNNVYVKILTDPNLPPPHIDVEMLYNIPTAVDISQEDIDRLANAWNS